MDVRIRPARAEDLGQIAAFATDTFEWGDYVVDSLPEWLDDPAGLVLVAETDRVVGVGRTVLLSDREAWLHGARVDQEHRRQGIGRRLNLEGCAWARSNGAVVARLMVETWNEVAAAQVTALGYRPVADWLAGFLDLDREVEPRSNGHKRLPGEERLAPGRRAEADLAWMAWASGETARMGRELYPVGWHFRRMHLDDLVSAAADRTLWQSPSGWVIVQRPSPQEMIVPWVATSDLDVDRLFRAVADLAEEERVASVRVMIPRTEWTGPALERAGYRLQPSTIYALDLIGTSV